MSGPNGETCDTCLFWDGLADGLSSEWGGAVTFKQCRRFPPVIDELAEQRVRYWNKGCWPVTPGKAWCGEFKLKCQNTE